MIILLPHTIGDMKFSRHFSSAVGEWGSYIAVVALFCVTATCYRQTTPLFETADEPSHFSVVKYIADTHTLPPFPTTIRTGPVPTVTEGVPSYYAPPLYYVLGALIVGDVPLGGFITAVLPNPDFANERGINFNDNYSSKNMYIHLAEQWDNSVAWGSAMWELRWFSLLLHSSVVVAALFVGGMLWPSSSWRWFPAGLIGLNSAFLYLSNGISNDPLLIALCSWCVVLWVSLLKRPSSQPDWRAGALIFLITAAFLTKQTAVILILPSLFVLYQQRQWRIRHRTAVLIFAFFFISIIGGSWYINNFIQTGDWVGFSSHMPLPDMTFTEHLRFFGQQLPGTFKSFWAAYGWATIFVADGWYVFFALLTIGGVTGWLLKGNTLPFTSSLVLWSITLLNGLFLLFWLWRTAAPYGRLLFPVIVPIACILTEGWRRWLLRLRWVWFDVGWQTAVLLSIAFLAIIAPTAYIKPALGSQVVQQKALADVTAVSMRFSDEIDLLGYRFVPADPEPGDEIRLFLYWQALKPIENNYEFTVQMSPQNLEQRVATEAQWLGSARYPTSIWQVGELVQQEVRLTVDDTAVAPSLYWFNVSVRNAAEMPLPVTFEGVPLSVQFGRLGPFRLTAVDQPIASLPHKINATFADAFKIDAYDVTFNDNQTALTLSLHWHANQPHPVDQTVFVHLLDGNNQPISQADHPPLYGDYPTSWWQAGDELIDTYHLDIPPNTDLTNAKLLIGMYDPQTATRLPAADSSGNLLVNDALTIQVMK